MNPNSSQKRISFGYNRNAIGKIILNDGQAATVQLIFSYYTDGYSIAQIKVHLETMNIPSPLNGKSWGKQTIANILSNQHYFGDDIYPTIISEEQFATAQQRKQRNIGQKHYDHPDNT